MILDKIFPFLRPAAPVPNESNREAWIEKVLAAIPEGGRILDAGAGTQRYRKFCKHLNYVSQDFAAYDGKGDSTGLQTGDFDYGKLDIVSNITSIPEPDSSFDAIMCIEVLEHLADPVLAIAEFARLLKPEGYLVITAPFCSLTHYAPHHYSSGFNRYWYEKHLDKNKFEIVELNSNGNFFDYMGQELGRAKSIGAKYAKSEPTVMERWGVNLVQQMLARFSRLDSNSSELLCFGYHVLARKISRGSTGE